MHFVGGGAGSADAFDLAVVLEIQRFVAAHAKAVCLGAVGGDAIRAGISDRLNRPVIDDPHAILRVDAAGHEFGPGADRAIVNDGR